MIVVYLSIAEMKQSTLGKKHCASLVFSGLLLTISCLTGTVDSVPETYTFQPDQQHGLLIFSVTRTGYLKWPLTLYGYPKGAEQTEANRMIFRETDSPLSKLDWTDSNGDYGRLYVKELPAGEYVIPL